MTKRTVYYTAARYPPKHCWIIHKQATNLIAKRAGGYLTPEPSLLMQHSGPNRQHRKANHLIIL